MKIYKLLDPLDNNIFYIGKTEQTLEERLVGHLHEAFHRTRLFPEKQEKIKEMVKVGRFPIIQLIEETLDTSRESYWVNKIKPKYNIIYNKDNRLSQFRSEMRSIPVYQYNLEGDFIREWKSATEVENTLIIDSTNISACLVEKRRQAGGYMWKTFKINKINSYRRNIFTKEVHMYSRDGDYLESFPSARHISGFNYKGISKCCNGKSKSYKNYKFSFEKKDKI